MQVRVRGQWTRRVLEAVTTAAFLLAAVTAQAATGSATNPGCERLQARACLDQAEAAMGGHDKLAGVKTMRLDVISHRALMEQSYRQAPFITSYERDQVTLDFAGRRLFEKQHAVWPESDLKQADSDLTLIVTPAGGVYRSDGQDSACGASALDKARQDFMLGPLRVLLTAADAKDLHYAPPATLRSTSHTVLTFKWNGIPVRLLLNRFNHLPDAVETTQTFRDFWFYWGDVQQRVDFDNWRYVDGLEFPSNEITERNGAVWNSAQALDISINPPTGQKDFAIDAKAAAQSLAAKGFAGATFHATNDKPLADGIDLFLGSWNTTVIRQPDGIVILETPISSSFTEGILAEAKRRYPGVPIKAVLSTSDSWPHVGGIRFDVAQGLPVTILDLNQPLLDRMVNAPHTLDPDAQTAARKKPRWTIVSRKTEIGAGPNRMVLYPLRGASTERQYMVYFPERRLLYASDTLVLNADNTIYDPELTHEVEQAVEREHLAVDTVFAMHQAPVAWTQVLAALHKST
ncbi:MAG TPA: MBL fold metallo-hydrolase [Acidobacteriaceae bacterium]|jgi:hypothetical protein